MMVMEGVGVGSVVSLPRRAGNNFPANGEADNEDDGRKHR